MKKKKIYALTGAVISLSILIGSATFAAENSMSDNDSIAWTIKRLKSEEERDVNIVEKMVDEVNKDVSSQKFSMKVAKRTFSDVAFLGDSITTYLADDSLLGGTNVLAKKGEHLPQAKTHLKELEKLKPKVVVILYGANDIGATTPEQFKEDYISLIKKIKAKNKHVKIYIQAPLPVYEERTIKNDSKLTNENVRKFSNMAKQAAKATGATYLPSGNLIKDKAMYANDGIHLSKPFYNDWLFSLKENIKEV